MRIGGKAYGDIVSILNVSRQNARDLCNYQVSMKKKKRGPKQKNSGIRACAVRLEINNIKLSGEKVTTTKVISNL